MKNQITIFLLLVATIVSAQSPRVFTAKCNVAQSGSGSGYWQVAVTSLNDPGGLDATEIQTNDKLLFNDGGIQYTLNITTVISAVGASATIRVSNVGVTGISSVPTTAAVISRGTANYDFVPFPANISANDVQLLQEKTMYDIDSLLQLKDPSSTNELTAYTAAGSPPGSPKQGDRWAGYTGDSIFIYNSGAWVFDAVRVATGGAGSYTASNGIGLNSSSFRLGNSYMLSSPSVFSVSGKINLSTFSLLLGKDSDSTMFILNGSNGMFSTRGATVTPTTDGTAFLVNNVAGQNMFSVLTNSQQINFGNNHAYASFVSGSYGLVFQPLASYPTNFVFAAFNADQSNPAKTIFRVTDNSWNSPWFNVVGGGFSGFGTNTPTRINDLSTAGFANILHDTIITTFMQRFTKVYSVGNNYVDLSGIGQEYYIERNNTGTNLNVATTEVKFSDVTVGAEDTYVQIKTLRDGALREQARIGNLGIRWDNGTRLLATNPLSEYVVADASATTIAPTSSHYTVTVNTASNTEPIVLPTPAAGYGDVLVVVKNIGSASNNITVSATGGGSDFYDNDASGATSTSSTVAAPNASKSYQCVNLGGTYKWIVL